MGVKPPKIHIERENSGQTKVEELVKVADIKTPPEFFRKHMQVRKASE
jgi:hypothetical protein